MLKENLDRAGSIAGDKLRETTQRVREGATDAYAVARERAETAYATAKTTATETGKRAQDMVEDNPVAALIGGLAIGAVIGALLPRARKESELLGGLGSRLGEAGRGQLDKLGFTPDAAREKVSKLIDGAIDAVRKPD